ncbi:hypothetical protein BC567DRAFT_286107 [Phyllosticta citribraziliensis]
MVAWTAQVDQKLLIALFNHYEKPIPWGAIASDLVAMGVAGEYPKLRLPGFALTFWLADSLTGKAVSRHMDKLKTDVAAGKIPSGNDGNHANNINNMVAEAGKLTKSAKKNAGIPVTPDKKAKGKGNASASSTPANTEKKRKRVLDDIGFRPVAEDTPMQDESPAKRLLSNGATAGERSQGPLYAGTAFEVMSAATGGPRDPFYEEPVTPVRTKAHSPLDKTEDDDIKAEDDDEEDLDNIDYIALIEDYYD